MPYWLLFWSSSKEELVNLSQIGNLESQKNSDQIVNFESQANSTTRLLGNLVDIEVDNFYSSICFPHVGKKSSMISTA